MCLCGQNQQEAELMKTEKIFQTLSLSTLVGRISRAQVNGLMLDSALSHESEPTVCRRVLSVSSTSTATRLRHDRCFSQEASPAALNYITNDFIYNRWKMCSWGFNSNSIFSVMLQWTKSFCCADFLLSLIHAWKFDKTEEDLLAFQLKTYNRIQRRRTGESEIIHKFLYVQG